jgi:hypothetical protein
MSNKECHLLIRSNERTRDRFKTYCHNQNVSMTVAINALMETSAKKNFPIKTRMRMK